MLDRAPCHQRPTCPATSLVTRPGSAALRPLLLFTFALVVSFLAACQAKVNPVNPGDTQDLSFPSGSMSCPPGTKCANAAQVCCPGEDCVDTTTNPNHCGGCGKSCGSGEVCDQSQCKCSGTDKVCSSGTSCCPQNGGCVNLDTDPRNCGSCGKTCSNNETCKGGGCTCSASGIVCPINQLCCSTGCVDTQSDANNCGTCGKKCKMGCIKGVCGEECSPSCQAGETCCSSKCANLLNDAKNCGVCGKDCGMFLGFPVPCLFGICAGSGQDGGVQDMSMPRG